MLNKPNIVGEKVLYLNHNQSYWNSAEIAACDQVYSEGGKSMSAYTATVAKDQDSHKFGTPDAGSDLVAGNEMTWSIFIASDNDLGNLLWNIDANANFQVSGAGASYVTGDFLFGRRNSSDTVVYSKAASANMSGVFRHLSGQALEVLDTTNNVKIIKQSIQRNLYTEVLSTGYVYYLAYNIRNLSANTVLIRGSVTLALRKHVNVKPVFNPERA